MHGSEDHAFGEVQYYFEVSLDDTPHAFAVVKNYGDPDIALLEKSCNTIWSCRRQSECVVIDVKDILSVVAVIPRPSASGALGSYDGQVFIAEKIGLDAMELIDVPARDENHEEIEDEDDDIYM